MNIPDKMAMLLRIVNVVEMRKDNASVYDLTPSLLSRNVRFPFRCQRPPYGKISIRHSLTSAQYER